MMTEAEIRKQIADIEQQRQQALAVVNACEGAITAFRQVLGELPTAAPQVTGEEKPAG